MNLPPSLSQSLKRLRRGVCEAVGVWRYSRPALYGIDRKLERWLDRDGGVFIEAGANDGVRQSNTYFLEKKRGWTGLLVEPVPELAAECRKNRRAAVVREWLREETTVGEDRIAALRAPAGMDIGAETAEEIALSILAELVQVRRGRATPRSPPGPATVAGGIPASIDLAPVVDDIVLLDPVCGMTVEGSHARHLAEHDGTVYAFCSIGCRTRFIKEPVTYLTADPSTRSM